MSVRDAFAAFEAGLPQRSPEVLVLVAAGAALATEIDDASVPDDKGKTRTAAAAVSALRGLLDDLIAKGRAVADDGEADAGWITPSAVADLAAVRDAARSVAGDARPRGGRGRKAPAKAVDAVAAARG